MKSFYTIASASLKEMMLGKECAVDASEQKRELSPSYSEESFVMIDNDDCKVIDE
jgi:hypothetical protein